MEKPANEHTTIILPAETKKQVRIVAAEMSRPMGTAALELIKIGLKEYQKLKPLYADHKGVGQTESSPAVFRA